MALDINAARNRATRVVKSFSPQQLLILGAMAVVGVMGLMALLRWVSQPSYAMLMAGDVTEVSKATAALGEAGIGYQLSAGGGNVLVANDKLAAARLALSQAGVTTGGRAQGYELLDQQGLTTSEFKQRVDLQRALEGQLTNMLLDMQAIDSARVQLSLPEKALFSDDQQEARAAVLVGTNASMDSSTVRAIMQTVASAVPDLKAENVTVTDTTGQILSVDGMSAGDDPLKMARRYEAATAAQAQSMLDTILGPGRSVVRVSAEMDFDQVESRQTTHAGDPIVLGSESKKESLTGPGAGDAAGVIGVTGTTLATDTAAATGQSYTNDQLTTSAAVDTTETVTKANPGKVQRLSVAVAVDAAILDELGVQPSVLNQLVVAAVGADTTARADGGRGDTVVVQPQTFDTAAATAAEAATKAASSAKTRSTIAGYAKTVGALVVLLLALLFLRKGLRSGRDEVDEIDAAILRREVEPYGVLRPGAAVPGTALAGRRAVPAPAAVGGGDGGGGTGGDDIEAERRALDPAAEVLDLIDREPDDVAALLRSWVADRRS